MPELIRSGSPKYDTARAVFNLTADLRPAAVCIATSAGEVQAVIGHARAQGLRVAPLTTGHLAPALPDLKDTILLRPELHHGDVTVDPVARTARIKAGARWEDVVTAVAPHGLAVMHGSSPTVGVVGYLLGGGGLSWYGRAHGLAVNHVRAFEAVTADGELRQVDAGHDPDLFHALRGGGGNFAVVTAVEIGLLPYAEVTAGTLFFPADHAGVLLRAWRDWGGDAPETVMSIVRLMTLPALAEIPQPLREVPVIRFDVTALHPGDAAVLERRLRSCAQPIMGGFGPRPSAEIARLAQDPEDPAPAVTDGFLLETLDDETIGQLLASTGPGSPLFAAELRHLGGALSAPPAGAGARGHLEGSYSLLVSGIPGAPAPAEQLTAHLDRCLDALRPWATGTRYSNFAERSGSLEDCNLGFTVDERFESHGTTFVYLAAGDVKIELLAGASQRNGVPSDNVLTSMDLSRRHHFCIAVANLDSAVARLLKLDVPLIGGPMEIPEIGQRIVFITDNVGTIIEVTEPGTWPAGRNGRA